MMRPKLDLTLCQNPCSSPQNRGEYNMHSVKVLCSPRKKREKGTVAALAPDAFAGPGPCLLGSQVMLTDLRLLNTP